MSIKCCNGCVAPKRHTACWGHCPEYIAEKAEYERRKEEYYREDRLTGDIVGDRGKKVRNALKGYRKSKIRER